MEVATDRVVALKPPETKRTYGRDLLLLSGLFLLGYSGFRRSKLAALLGLSGVVSGLYRPPHLTVVKAPESLEAKTEESKSLPQARSQMFIDAKPTDVYGVARDLSTLEELWPDVKSVDVRSTEEATISAAVGGVSVPVDVKIIADQPGEFFAYRLEHDGKDQANCLLSFDTAPGDMGTVVSVTVRHNRSLGLLAAFVKPAIDKQISGYLDNLKIKVESMPAADPVADGNGERSVG